MTGGSSATDVRPPPVKRRRQAFGWVDFVLAGLVAAFIAYFVWRTNSVLHYRWNWGSVWPWVIRYDAQTETWIPGAILGGLATTLRLAVFGLVLAAIIGVVMGFMRVSKRLLPRMISTSYVMLIRNIPPLVFVFVFVFFITSQILPSLGIADAARGLSPTTQWWLSWFFGPVSRIENFFVGLICLAVFTGAYVTEIVRAGIESVPKSQIEAGESLGLTRLQVMRDVVFPQAMRNVVPPMAGQFIQMIKDSSLVSLVSVQELTFVAQDIQTSAQRVFEILLFVGGVYFVICWTLSMIFGRLEHTASKERR
ncbi:MAG TPA: amino acid ABC transporter permease [Beijerinckiaceae bacterium]|nr:amino acid ABC transporter permease [Beijerinckiaceae bacterium]